MANIPKKEFYIQAIVPLPVPVGLNYTLDYAAIVWTGETWHYDVEFAQSYAYEEALHVSRMFPSMYDIVISVCKFQY